MKGPVVFGYGCYWTTTILSPAMGRMLVYADCVSGGFAAACADEMLV